MSGTVIGTLDTRREGDLVFEKIRVTFDGLKF